MSKREMKIHGIISDITERYFGSCSHKPFPEESKPTIGMCALCSVVDTGERLATAAYKLGRKHGRKRS